MTSSAQEVRRLISSTDISLLMGGACNTRGRDEKWIPDFGKRTRMDQEP